MKAGHLPNLNRHNASFALDKQASLHHHMALHTPIHTCQRKEFCASERTSLSEDPPGGRRLCLTSDICRAILKTGSEAKASFPKVS